MTLKIHNPFLAIPAAVMAVIGIIVGFVTLTGHNIFFGAMFGCMAWVLAKTE